MTGAMANRPSRMPEANKMARMLRSGRTPGELATRYGVHANAIMQQLTANGWDASTGAWVGGDQKDYVTGAPLAIRGGGPGESCHHVGGGDNPSVVSMGARTFHQRPRATGFAWPDAPPAVPLKRRSRRAQVSRRKITAAQEAEMAKRYLDGESSVTLAREYQVNERTVRKHLSQLGVVLRSRGEALRLRHAQLRAAETVAVGKDVF